MKNQAFSEIDALYDEIRPAVEEHERDKPRQRLHKPRGEVDRGQLLQVQSRIRPVCCNNQEHCLHTAKIEGRCGPERAERIEVLGERFMI